jgi:hypothetical protein
MTPKELSLSLRELAAEIDGDESPSISIVSSVLSGLAQQVRDCVASEALAGQRQHSKFVGRSKRSTHLEFEIGDKTELDRVIHGLSRRASLNKSKDIG